jgi:DNA-binding NarL/FixJ family response regulator
MKKVIIIVRSFVIRAGVKAWLQEMPGITVEKTFSGDEPRLLSAVGKHQPDMVVMDPSSLTEENDALPRQLRKNQKPVLLALTHRSMAEKFAGAFHDFLFYEDDRLTLEQKIRKFTGRPDKTPGNKPLSQREITILKLIVQGHTHQEIADKLFLSIHTVNTHRKNINKKLGIKTVSGLSVYAIMHRLIEVDELARKR